MSRDEHADVSHIDLPNPENDYITHYYLPDGICMSKQQYIRSRCNLPICAKTIKSNTPDRKGKLTGKTQYYVLTNNRNQIFDPKETDGRYKIRNRWKYTTVRYSTFETYIKFLKEKYRSLLIQAEREL